MGPLFRDIGGEVKMRTKVRGRRGHQRRPHPFPLLDDAAFRDMGASTRVVLSGIH